MSGTSRVGIALVVIVIVWFFVYWQRCAAPVMNAFDESGRVALTEDDSVGRGPDDRSEDDESEETSVKRPPADLRGDGRTPGPIEPEDSPGAEDEPPITEIEGEEEEPGPELPPPPPTTPYAVQSGDTMESIAADWFGDKRKWVLIAQENPTIDPMKLKVGQALRLPAKEARLEDLPPDVLDELTRQVRYRVSPGDTLSGIANRIYGDPNLWRLIYDANRDQLASPDALQLDMELIIPPRQIPAGEDG